MILNITKLTGGFLLVRYQYYQKPKTVVLKTTEHYEDGTSKLVDEKVTFEDLPPLLSDEMFIFTEVNFSLMQDNYKLGNCTITLKGLRRYSMAYGCGESWYGCPARTARRFAKEGVALPKSCFGIYTYINKEV